MVRVFPGRIGTWTSLCFTRSPPSVATTGSRLVSRGKSLMDHQPPSQRSGLPFVAPLEAGSSSTSLNALWMTLAGGGMLTLNDLLAL